MNRLAFVFTLLASLLALAGGAAAHEVRPAFIEIDQTAAHAYHVLWKQPVMGDVAIHLEPHLSNGWLEQPPADQYATPGFLIRSWIIRSPAARPLDGKMLTIEGLQDTITDVYVRLRLGGDRRIDAILRPESPSLKITPAMGSSMGAWSFLLLGVRHILTGPDHLLFLLGLLLIVSNRAALLKTVSAFTLAHSITLALAAFGLIRLPTDLLNALVALSILFLAPEVLRAGDGGTSLTVRYPWVVAFGFGLLHGMGFASGLTPLGLDRGALAGALVLFNLGVELGQLAFVALALALVRAFRLMEIRWPRPAQLAPPYAIGVLGAAWTFRYGAALFGLAS